MTDLISFIDLGQMEYGQALAAQERAHAEVLAGGPERVFLVQHPPVITLGRRDGCLRNLLISTDELHLRGIDLVQTDRGGDITFHGPGQLVAYPIIRLASHALSVSGYVHRLESIVISTLAELGIKATTDPQAVGVWTANLQPAKICAIGVRIRRGVTLHGLALNVTTDLRYFQTIIPCGLETRSVTSVASILGDDSSLFDRTKTAFIAQFLSGLPTSISRC